MRKLDSGLMTQHMREAEPQRHRRLRQDREVVGLQIDDFPVKLKRRLIAEADKRGTNMSEVAVETLAILFGVKFFPSGRRPPNVPGDSTSVVFRMPRRLRRKIKSAALAADTSARSVVISALTVRFPK